MNIDDFRNDLSIMSLEDCLIKYNISFYDAFRVCHRENLQKSGNFSLKFLSKNSKSKYRILKMINGKRYNYGSYDLDTAKLVRDELIKVNWDMNQLENIKEKLGVV